MTKVARSGEDRQNTLGSDWRCKMRGIFISYPRTNSDKLDMISLEAYQGKVIAAVS